MFKKLMAILFKPMTPKKPGIPKQEQIDRMLLAEAKRLRKQEHNKKHHI